MENYQFVKALGKGTFGEVVLYFNGVNGRYEAVKTIQQKSSRFKPDEVKHHRMVLPHPNIIDFNSIYIDDNEDVAYISLAYAPSGDMFHAVKDAILIEPIACFYFKQLLDAVEHCHDNNVIHNDIKLENLLLDGYTLKLCDFGYSQPRDAYNYKSIVGTAPYLAPEMILRQKHDGTKSDIWACGVVLYCMLCGAYPYKNPQDTKSLIVEILALDIPIPKKLSADCQDFLRRIFVADPCARLPIRELRAHNWMHQHFL